jgi:hypothetical protein
MEVNCGMKEMTEKWSGSDPDRLEEATRGGSIGIE